jgi:pimeloyl-ACP methyl ester carboxylesterase
MATGALNWYPSLPRLAAQYRVVTIDHRGHGRGIRTDGPFRLADCADDAAALLEELAIDDAIVVGYSMGGPIAQLLWRRHPDRVTGLVLCATSAVFRQTPFEHVLFAGLGGASWAMRRRSGPVGRSPVTRQFVGRFDDADTARWAARQVARHDRRLVVQAGHAIGRFSSTPWITQVDIPTAVVLTRQDRLVPPARQLRTARAITGATVHDVDGDHVACATDPERFVPALLDAVESVVSRRHDRSATS